MADGNGIDVTSSTGSWLSHDPSTLTFTIQSSAYSDIGIYTVIVDGTSPSLVTESLTFTIEIKDPCNLASTVVSPVSSLVIDNSQTETRALSASNTMESQSGTVGVCGAYSFIFSPALS